MAYDKLVLARQAKEGGFSIYFGEGTVFGGYFELSSEVKFALLNLWSYEFKGCFSGKFSGCHPCNACCGSCQSHSFRQ